MGPKASTKPNGLSFAAIFHFLSIRLEVSSPAYISTTSSPNPYKITSINVKWLNLPSEVGKSMHNIRRLMKTDIVRVKIRREYCKENWPDITQLIINIFPKLVQTFKEADSLFQEKVSMYPLEYYELFVRPAVAILSPEEAEMLIMTLEEKTSAKADDTSFKVSFGGNQYTISFEYPCG
ncbi:MAG: hypothetical protein QXF84_02580 [Nitrososphaerota archaeon]